MKNMIRSYRELLANSCLSTYPTELFLALLSKNKVGELFLCGNIKAKGTMESNALVFSWSKEKMLLSFSRLALNVVKRNATTFLLEYQTFIPSP